MGKIQFSLPQVQRKNIPPEVLIQVLGNNPLAKGIDSAAASLSQAFQEKAKLKKEMAMGAKLESTYGLKPGTLSGLPTEQASSVGRAIYDKEHPTDSFSYMGSSEDGKKLLFLNSKTMETKVQDNPIGAPLAGKTRDPFAEERLGLQKERLGKDIIDKFNSAPNVVKAKTSIDAANNVRALIDSNNPIAAGAIPTYMARASGEVGNLSEADKAPFGGSQAILSRLQAALTEKATGRLTPENAQFLASLSDVMENSARRNLENEARTRSKQYSRSGNMKEDDIFESLFPKTSSPSLNPALQPMPTGGLPPDKEARYQELLRKKQQGTLR